MTKKRNNSLNKYIDETIPSDNTRVESPYRIQQRVESQLQRPSVDLRKTVFKLREQQEEKARQEKLEQEAEQRRKEAERAEEDRLRGIKERHQKELKQKQDSWEAEKKSREEQSAKLSKEKQDLYEPEYKAWLEDVQKHPDDYSNTTQEVVKRAMHSYKHPSDYLARVDRGIARALFNIKNAAGQTALSSIDTNGTTIEGAMSLLEVKKEALKYHDYRLQLQQSINDLDGRRKNLSDTIMRQYGITPETAALNPDDPVLQQFREEYNELTNQIKGIQAQLNDPQSKQFDDLYKQLYTIDKEGFWASAGRNWRRSVNEAYGYDQYKDYIAQREKERDIADYNNILIDEQYKANRGYTGADYLFQKVPQGAGYRAPSVQRRTLDSYSPQELLELDVNRTNIRSKELEEETKALQKEYKENRKHFLDSTKYWNVSEYYKKGVQAHQFDDMWNLDYMFYELPQMIGSTYSSPQQGIATMLSGASIAAYASSPWTGGIGTLLGAGLDIAATPFQKEGGYDENRAEAGEKRIEQFKSILKDPNNDRYEQVVSELKQRSREFWKHQGIDEETINKYLDGEQGENNAIKDMFMGLTDRLVDQNNKPYIFAKDGTALYENPIADPEFFKARLYSAQGLQALFDANNMRTMAGLFFEKMLTLTPTAWLKKAATVKFNKMTDRWIVDAAEDVVTDGAGRVTARSAAKAMNKKAINDATRETYANGFRKGSFAETFTKGANRGAAIGEMTGFGFTGQAIGWVGGGALNTAARIGLSALSPAARAAYRTAEGAVIHKFQNIYDKLLPSSEFGRAVWIYGGKTARATAASQLSEAAEEAVQYLNSKEDFASRYGWGGMSIGDMIVNDIYQGARVFDSYMSLFGLSNSELLNDAEYWANAKGGFALGGVHTGTMRAAIEGANAYKEYGIHSSILTSNVMNREAELRDRAANVEFARQAMRNRTSETISVLDWMQKNDRRREDPYFSQEDYDEKILAANTIKAMVNSKTIREGLEAKGFKYGSEEYANAIADLYSINRQREQNIEESKEKENNVNALWNSPEYQKEADAIIKQELASNFDEHLGRHSAIIAAGNKAVSEEIARAKQAGEDVETSDFKKHLQNIRKEAQEQAAQSIDLNYRQNLLQISHIAHKLQSLIKLRAQHNTISDFFTFLNSKFDIRPKRPDAKLIVQSVDKQIENAKKALAEADSNFDVEMTDGAILDYIKNLNIVNAHSDDIERHEIAAAMLEADRDVIDKHAQMFEFGLVRNKEGRLEYNPAAYKAKQERAKQLLNDLKSEKIKLDEYTRLSQEEQELPEYNEKDVENNPYMRRIQSIIETRKDNKALNAMINDIENGDGVVKIMEELAEKEYKTDTSEETKTKAKEESESFSFETEDETEPAPVVTEEVPKVTAKEKYKSRKAKAEERSKKRKENISKLRKHLRNRANAAFIPIPTPLLDIANVLITKAEIATYKIAQFAEELSNFARQRGYNAGSFLSGIKEFYIDKFAQVLVTQPELAENFSSLDEIKAFGFDIPAVPQPIVYSTAAAIQDKINKDSEKIDTELSTHYDTIVKEGDTVVVYTNREANANARFGQAHYEWKNTVDRLNAANTSDKEFKAALEHIFANIPNVPIDRYVKYRDVSGMVEAIANRKCNHELQRSVQFGKLMRKIVLSIIFDREDNVDISTLSGDYQAFRQQVLDFKKKLTSKENGMGLTIIDTDRTIYGTDPDGNKISSEADIIATDGNKLYVIDIRYSFDSIRLNWKTKYPKATYTIEEHVTRRVKQIEQIINSAFNRGVNGLYCLPIVYNPEEKILYVEVSKDKFLIPIKPDTQDEHDESIEGQRKAVQDFVEQINGNISEYNTLVEEALRYVTGYEPLQHITAQQFESVQEYVDYLNTLHAQYDTLTDRINQLKTIINQQHNLYDEVWVGDTNGHISVQDMPEAHQMYARLKEICADLDLVLDEIPSLKITTETERNNIDKLIETIFDAQFILDRLLSDPYGAVLDLHNEEELIASALEKMAQNKENFGKAGMFVRRWWATQFAVGSHNNISENVRTISDIYFGYRNKIQSWVDTLRNHVLTEIAEYPDLQEWYSAILNNYFAKLLDNAEQFAKENLTDGAQIAAIEARVNQGRQLIQEFNNAWDTRPEEDFNGPSISPEVDKINRMPVKWMDKWGISDSIMPSFDQMRNPIYYWLSISPTFLDSEFTLSLDKDGKLQLRIEGTSYDGSKRNITLTFENNLAAADERDLERWEYVNNARQKFIRKAIAAINFVNTHPGYVIKFDKNTNKGEIRYGTKDGNMRPVTDFIFAGNANKHDLYTIKLSKKDRVGVLVTLKGGELGPDVYSVKGGDNLIDDIGGFDRDYTKQILNTESGAIVYFYDTGNGQYIGTPIPSRRIGNDDAAKLVYLMQKYLQGDRIDQYGYNIMDLLNLRLYMADPSKKLSFRNNTSNMIRFEGGDVVIGEDHYDINTQADKLIARIAQMPNVTRANMMNESLRTSENGVLRKVRTLFGQSDYESVQLTNGLVFEKEDFTHKNTDPDAQDGSTWLGYMMRNGLLGSFAAQLGYKELRISNLRVLPVGFEETKPLDKEIEQAKQQQKKVVVKGDDFFERLAKIGKTGSLNKILEESEIDVNRGTEEQEGFVNDVISYFDSVLGDNGKVEFGATDKLFLDAVAGNERIGGICTTEMIKLSRYVPMSVAWHEAFHKIFELVIPATERDSFYKAYKNSIYGFFKNPSDRDIAEAFADMFMTYMENKQALDKADTLLKKIKPWIKTFAFNIGMVFKIGVSNTKEMYKLYGRINKGEYRNRTITQEQNDRFTRLFGEGLYYTVTNLDSKTSANFSHIADIGARDRLVRALSYYILKAYEIDGLNPRVERVRITGGTETMKGTPDKLAEMYDGAILEYLKSIHPVFEEVFEKVEKEYTKEDGTVVKRNYYPKFDALSGYISSYISTLFDTMRKPKIETDDADDSDTQDQTGENIDFKASDVDHWDKAAYEFSKLDGLMDEVKLFFGTIPYSKYEETTDDDGNPIRTVVVDYTRNEFGSPEFMPIEEVWNLIVRKFHDVSSLEELDKALEQYSTVKEVYAQVYQKFHALYKGEQGKSGIYKYNEKGEVIVAQTNFDREAKALQILSAIQSQNLTFLVGLSSKQNEGELEGKSVRIVESSMDRDSKSYPDQWTRYLVSGQIGVFKRERGEGQQVDSQGKRKKTVLLFRDGMGGKNGEDIFSRTSKFFSDLRVFLTTNNSEFTLDGVDYNTNIFDDVNRIKDEIVHRLCTIGIMFERDALDYMLSELYGGVDIEALRRFIMDSPASTDPQVIEDAKKSTISAFIDTLDRYVSDGGKINQDLIENKGYGDIGFVNKLANYQGQYKRMSTQSMALALNGKKLFTVSQNNSISHIIKQLNTFDLENETVKVLSGFGYNVTKDEAGMPIGSIILRAIQERKPLHIEGFTYIGFKTDNKGDQGSEYTDTATIEDYIAKLSMLQQGYLIFPTLADKGTWMLMNGIPIPGMRFVDSTDKDGELITTVTDGPTVRIINGEAYLIPNDKVLDQMIEYAKCELLGIQQCMEDLGYDNIPGYEKQGRHVLSEDEKIANYHTKNGNVEPNGTRFLSLTKIVTYDYNPETKKYELNTHNLNDPRESSVTLLKRAQDVFFARRDGETAEQMIARQRESIALTLAIQTKHEVETAVELGLVQRVGYSAKFGDKTVTVNSTDNVLTNLDTKDLNINQIRAVQTHIMGTTKTKGGILWKNVTDPIKRQFYSNMARSLAIASILQDATNRHIICSQEVQRCFSGHPALFKVKYGTSGIKDSAYDIQKRIGGMVSTGEDNILGIPGMKSEYTCAECNDYEVGSKSNIASRLDDMFSTSQARYIFAQKTGNWEDAYGMSIDALKEKYPNYAKLLDDALLEGKRYAKSFTKGINVADGASYITADMCRDMLRMRGAYNNDVRKAFKILMSSSKYDWKKSAEAYKTVYEALNIVPTKYTAYGFRQHSMNGSQVSDVAVAYYNKFALFPIFPCMATGKMEAIYDKMVAEGVDMLLMTSAVKVGSQGAVSFDGEGISQPFNKYTQSYAYLRRQLNTDPEEKDESALGTQMIKIGLANLDPERHYTDLDGNTISGRTLLDQLMGSINTLADMGAKEVEDMFFDTEEERDEDGNLVNIVQKINYEKMSDYLKDQLTTRNANKTLIQSIQVVTDPVTGAKKLATPLAATSDAAWIESIFISTMNKKIVDVTTPGKSFVQRSVFATEGEGANAGTINNGKKLQMINEEGSMDCVVSIDYFNDILPEGLSFEQAKQWLIDQGIISGFRTNEEDMSQEWVDAEAVMIGYRIPTQAQSSIHALRVVDVISATKTTIILPEEFTKITGSDFDIDHLYLASFNFRKDENGKLTRQFDVTDKRYHQNQILSTLMTLLKDTENTLNSLYKPIDNDTELVTAVSDYIPDTSSTKGDPYNFGTLHEQVIRKNDYITGKKGIGPFALNSTGHMLCRQFGVKFRGSKLVENTRLSNLDTKLDKDDNAVASWLSGFINAHVDIVKDPYISRLNVNPFTYNMLNLMIRCGWGDTSLWFLANPLIRAMADANDQADSQYMRRPNKNKSGRSRRDQLIYDAITRYLNEAEVSDETVGTLLGSNKMSQERIDIVNWLDENQDKLKDAAITGDMDHDTALHVYYAWKILEKYSRALGDLVQHTKVDTRKYGKNFMAVAKYYQEYNDIFNPKHPEESLWDISTLKKLDNGSWLRKKTDYVYSIPQKIFGSQTFSANQKFVDAVIEFARRLEYDGRSLRQDDVVNLSKHLQTAIKAKYFSDYAHDVLKMSDKDIADLFIGYRSMNRRLVSLKDLISNNPEYARLASNPFLNQIYSMLEDKPVFANGRELSDRPGFVTVLDNVDDSKLNSDLLSEGWLDLMNDENKYIRDFAKKFVVYAFFSSGEFKGWNKMLKYVPYEWISGQVDTQYKSYSKFIEEQLAGISDDYSDLYDVVVANNFMDYRFAKQMEEENDDGTRNFLNNDRGVRIGRGVSFDEKEQLPEYISIKKYKMRSGHQDSYDLFKQIGIVKVGKTYHPIYAKIKKRGYHTRGNDIYEYYWDFNYAENERAGSDTFDYDGAIKRVQEYIKNGELTGFSESEIQSINKLYIKEQEEQKVAPKSREVEPGPHIATRGYKKGDPQRHPKFNYVFTENAQAYIASGHGDNINIGVSTSRDAVKLNVSDVNGTNQAGIRTDASGNITPNAYGIVVKKFQQNPTGQFVAQEGAFKDTDEDFALFKQLNEDMFNRLAQSENNIIIFPSQMALGKAALPLRFAEWLRDQLLDRFGVVSEVSENKRNDYEGYGLQIKEVVPKESNLRKDRDYDWKYEEDSGYSGVLQELPPRVRMNGKFTYRPKYDFGRVYLTGNEREYITEHVSLLDEYGNIISKDATRIENVTKQFIQYLDHFINKTKKKYVTISYRDWKTMLQIEDKLNPNDDSVNQFEMFIDKEIDYELDQIHGITQEETVGEYDKRTKTIQIEEDYYSMIKLLHDNIDILKDLMEAFGYDEYTLGEALVNSYTGELYEMFDMETGYGDTVGTGTIQYSYTDSRQQELFSDEDFDPSFAEHCKH